MSTAVLKSETFIGETVWFKEVLQQWRAVLLPVKPREIGNQNHLNVLHQQKAIIGSHFTQPWAKLNLKSDYRTDISDNGENTNITQ